VSILHVVCKSLGLLSAILTLLGHCRQISLSLYRKSMRLGSHRQLSQGAEQARLVGSAGFIEGGALDRGSAARASSTPAAPAALKQKLGVARAREKAPQPIKTREAPD
jgi:hypothetical protein